MSEDRLIFIIAGGEIRDLEFLRSRIEKHSPRAIVCADGGARYAHALGLIPALIVGDMDSLPAPILEAFREQGSIIRTFPRQKDESDLELAFAETAQFNPRAVWVFGGLGFRLDHTLANLSLLLKGEACQIPVMFLDEWCEVSLIKGAGTIEGKIGQTVSLLPFHGEASGISLEGFQYPLKNGTMTPEKPFGISNRLTAEKGFITVESGRLIAIRYFREGIFPS